MDRNIIITDAGAGFHINGQLYLLTGWKNDFADLKFPSAVQASMEPVQSGRDGEIYGRG